MKKSIVMATLSVVLIGTSVYAGKNVSPALSEVVPVSSNPFYVGVGGDWALNSRNCDCVSSVPPDAKRLKDNSVGYALRAGFDINKYIGVEARYIKSKWNNNYAETTHYGAYLKPQYDWSNTMNFYGLIGYGNTDIKCNHNDVTKNYNKNGVALGAGVKYDIATNGEKGPEKKGVGVWLDYTNLLHNSGKDKINANVLTAGVTYDF